MVYAPSWEDVCEGAICSQSFTGFANGASAGSVPNVSTSGFKISGNGASGSTSDQAAWSANTATNYLAFKHTQLETGYEYRISVNAKSRYSGKTLAFGYGPALNQSQAIGAPAPVLTVHPSLPGAVVTSDLFTVDQAGIYYIILRPGGPGSGNVILDDYRLERRAVNDGQLKMRMLKLEDDELKKFNLLYQEEEYRTSQILKSQLFPILPPLPPLQPKKSVEP